MGRWAGSDAAYIWKNVVVFSLGHNWATGIADGDYIAHFCMCLISVMEAAILL
jgi:hypothetical protein